MFFSKLDPLTWKVTILTAVATILSTSALSRSSALRAPGGVRSRRMRSREEAFSEGGEGAAGKGDSFSSRERAWGSTEI